VCLGAIACLAVLAGLSGCDGGSDKNVVATPISPGATTNKAGEPVLGAEGTTAKAPATKPTGQEGPASGGGQILSASALSSFQKLAASLGGEAGLAVSGVGLNPNVEETGSLHSAVAWSTSKVPIAMAVIAAGGASAQQGNLSQAIAESDNAAAERLWSTLGGDSRAAEAADQQLRAAGDDNTAIESRQLRAGFSAFGQTDWALADQARFTAGMACTKAGAQVLGLMNQVASAQRWGLGSAGVEAQLKGGWGPGSRPGTGGGYLDRQMGVMKIDGKPVAVAIAVQPASGTHESGTANLTSLARWLVANANTKGLPAAPNC
jgi:hypothetical protein